MNGQRLRLSVHMFSLKINNTEAFRCFLTEYKKQHRIILIKAPIRLQKYYFFKRYHNLWHSTSFRGKNLNTFTAISFHHGSFHCPVWKTQTTSTDCSSKGAFACCKNVKLSKHSLKLSIMLEKLFKGQPNWHHLLCFQTLCDYVDILWCYDNCVL